MDLFRAQFSKDSVAWSFGLACDGRDARNPVLQAFPNKALLIPCIASQPAPCWPSALPPSSVAVRFLDAAATQRRFWYTGFGGSGPNPTSW